ncbi:uncharacterized protein BP5553_01399 [Venustampulla echinocandica]|uniref:Glycosyl transferase CAP10 domain-containing protein n=1 Tax=Venustampulla echinocandica TaxID=2656787 RepID=A0A370U0V8_9HELO|nr:uncharacterized protein BP5553_01399 [Venustampulla echinocandica]RDL41420.1 hypothetical protein BP5553_01399 [Venustampulla echinocandica]
MAEEAISANHSDSARRTAATSAAPEQRLTMSDKRVYDKPIVIAVSINAMSYPTEKIERDNEIYTSKDLCDICSTIEIEALFEKELEWSENIELGSLDQVYSKQSQCPFCHLLITAIDSVRRSTNKKSTAETTDRENLDCSLSNRIASISEASKDRFVNRFGTDSLMRGLWHFRISISVYGWAQDGKGNRFEDETFAELQQVQPPTRQVGLFDPLPIFSKRSSAGLSKKLCFSLVRKWLSWCELNHGAQCAPGHEQLHISTLRVIDVIKNCVVDVSTGSRYITLSYVWGSTPMLRLTTANRKELYQEGSLDLSTRQIPQTIHDAILIARELGERYLWVDAICIIQDDPQDSERYISKMDHIYSGSSLTLVAASGTDANAGLPGVRSGTRDMENFQDILKVDLPGGPQELAVARGLLLPLLAFSRWDTRGWTYQERAFSHRLLYFTSEQVYFQCRRNTWCEDTVLEVDDPQLEYDDLPLYRFGIPREKERVFLDSFDSSDMEISLFELYTKVVEGFSRRDLTYEGDVLKAFGGLAREVYRMDGESGWLNPDPHTPYFHFGIPSPWFHRALLWSPAQSSGRNSRRIRSQTPLSVKDFRRRVVAPDDLQMPSWSWAGWVGPIDYRYVLHGYHERDVVSHVSYYIPSPNSAQNTDRSIDGGLQQIQPTSPTEPRARWCQNDRPVEVSAASNMTSPSTSPPPHLLFFYTSRAFLSVVPDNDRRSDSLDIVWCDHFIGQRYSHVTNRILLPSDWLTSPFRPSDGKYEFIALSNNRHGYMHVMLISHIGAEPDAIAERVSVGDISQNDWDAAEPDWVSSPQGSGYFVLLPLTPQPPKFAITNKCASTSTKGIPRFNRDYLPLQFHRLWPFVAGLTILLFLSFTLFGRDFSQTVVIPWRRPVDHTIDAVPGADTNDNNVYDDISYQDHANTVTDPPLPPEETIPLPSTAEDSHPIVELLHHADDDYRALLKKETYDLASAAQRYREKRGRHPPPGFDRWWQYARDNHAMIVEDFWDPIYDDVNPMWALDPLDMQKDVLAQRAIFQIRGGNVTFDDGHFWMPTWRDMIQSVAAHLPDMDIAMNTMDESRLLIPWEKMKEYVEAEHKGRKLPPPDQVNQTYSGFPKTEKNPEFPWDKSHPVWPRIIQPCSPNSTVRTVETHANLSEPPKLDIEHMKPHLYRGYVSNYSLSTSVCHQPDLRDLHGFFIEAISVSTSPKLFPMFGSSKLGVNSEILLPAVMYYKFDEEYASQAPPVPWERKKDAMVWRGLASGGRSKADNWKGFHRHRLISMLNGTQALKMHNSSSFIDIESLPLDEWNLKAWNSSIEERHVDIGNWLSNFTSEVGFTNLKCFPDEPEGLCSYTNYLLSPLKPIMMGDQHNFKYLPDVDGNSFSGRYRDFLISGSLPIKATMFREWHDSRLIAWKHFVPFDNRFLDLYGIMEFFLGYPVGTGRDHLAHKIAEEGRDWAKKVLRQEDMRIYTYRLLLEYARVMDGNRDNLGWVGDLG